MSENILKDNVELNQSKVYHFKDRVDVKNVENESNQISIFYGKDKKSNRNIIVKQFTGESAN